MATCTLGILSDIHYASAAEQARGSEYEMRAISNRGVRLFARFYYDYLWLRNPLGQNHLLDQFLERANGFDYVIVNGDYSCNSACVGLSDDAALQSTRESVGKLRQRFGTQLRLNFGDHELGKVPMFHKRGGLRLASWHRAHELGLDGFWQHEIGNYVLIGFISTLVALPNSLADMLPDERPEWERLRAEHLAQIRRAFEALRPQQRVLLFCHDPTALPYLWREESIRVKLSQVEQTTIGHLHSKFILRKSRLLAGMPPIRFLGYTVQRLSTSLSEARHWRPFRVRLCPALAGVELLKDGGYCTLELDPEARQPAHFRFHRLHRS
jgi:hypothetical protein